MKIISVFMSMMWNRQTFEFPDTKRGKDKKQRCRQTQHSSGAIQEAPLPVLPTLGWMRLSLQTIRKFQPICPPPFLLEIGIPARYSLEAQSNAGEKAITVGWVTAQQAINPLRFQSAASALPLPFLLDIGIPARCSPEAQSNAGGTAIPVSWVTAQRAVNLPRFQ